MADGRTVDLSRLLDDRKFNAFNVRLVALSFFVMLLDGYDITVMGFAVPQLAGAWGIADRGAFGPVLSASLFGMLVGAPLFGFVGDRYGRRIAIVLSCVVVGLFTWSIVFAGTLTHLFWLRFLAGIGIGGILANISAINAEFAPRRFQATAIMITFIGTAVGGAFPGPVTAALVPHFGWPALFHIGGILPLAMAAIVAWAMPESVRFLALRPERHADVRRTVSLLEPGLKLPEDVQFTVRDEGPMRPVHPKYLFADGLAPITILLWCIVAMSLMAYFFLISWMPTLLTSASIPLTQAALITGVLQLGGVTGALVIARLVDKYRVLPIVVLFALGAPVVAALGYLGTMSMAALVLIVFLAGFSALGIQIAMGALCAIIYPTALRASGVGWSFGIGRLGSIVGPLLGGALISAQLTVQQLYLVAVVPFVVGAVLSFMLLGMYARRMDARVRA
jgi:AAHS family 4-hydroxybenzoate transporter-like MFS transporter